MKVLGQFARAVALSIVVGFAAPALADDPNDPAMTAEAIARDRATIQRLNREQLEYVRRRDAGYTHGWQSYDAARDRRTANDADYAAVRRTYAEERRQYERDMRQWRQDVAACRAGDDDHCAR